MLLALIILQGEIKIYPLSSSEFRPSCNRLEFIGQCFGRRQEKDAHRGLANGKLKSWVVYFLTPSEASSIFIRCLHHCISIPHSNEVGPWTVLVEPLLYSLSKPQFSSPAALLQLSMKNSSETANCKFSDFRFLSGLCLVQEVR